MGSTTSYRFPVPTMLLLVPPVASSSPWRRRSYISVERTLFLRDFPLARYWSASRPGWLLINRWLVDLPRV